MATAWCSESEDPFLCSICLDIFTDPVTIPCGHNFCKSCITKRWISDQQQCPTCKELFAIRPALRINTSMSEAAASFRSSAQSEARSYSRRTLVVPDQVLCDVCTERRKKAVKSCWDCLTSYCETHLEPHKRITCLRSHKLTQPGQNLEEVVCERHGKPLEMFCKMDKMFMCQTCAASSHKKHHVVPLIQEYKGKKKDLERTGAQLQQMIQERLLKMEQIKQSVKLSKEESEQMTAVVIKRCAALIKSSQKIRNQLLEVVEQKQKMTEEQAEGCLTKLEEEISELVEMSDQFKQLSQTENHLLLLQNFPSLKVSTDWTDVRVASSCDGTVRKTAVELETLSKQMKKLSADVELSWMRLHAVDVTLDRATANPYLHVSDDGKIVGCGDVEQDLPDTPERLSFLGILGEQSFSSGRFYYEVQVEGKTKWELGVVRGSISRKGENTICPENGYWAVWLRNGLYRALCGPSVPLFVTLKPQKVGVFVDYDVGLVCFYDADAALPIYTFTGCKFTEKLYPYFSPCPREGGKNSAPLIISPIRQEL
ncbi:E3 ubiquitin-protein ligase TRIM39 [Nothobranchius furzeri]|uniref:E3 ubiquitin-protein ligase TRIM39-like n=1 Tax=Nothobranchius furzeri TaxID=105023 RepID=A0A8C6KE38_NOTFU|nr:E3 ubiquitin-protein ligase TRIM39-like [Nothobranchius furzeri]